MIPLGTAINLTRELTREIGGMDVSMDMAMREFPMAIPIMEIIDTMLDAAKESIFGLMGVSMKENLSMINAKEKGNFLGQMVIDMKGTFKMEFAMDMESLSMMEGSIRVVG